MTGPRVRSEADRAVIAWARALVANDRPGGPNLITALLEIIEPKRGKPGPKTGSRWPASKVRPCGTESAYKRHLNHNEDPCQSCTEAAARAATARKRARKGRRP